MKDIRALVDVHTEHSEELDGDNPLIDVKHKGFAEIWFFEKNADNAEEKIEEEFKVGVDEEEEGCPHVDFFLKLVFCDWTRIVFQTNDKQESTGVEQELKVLCEVFNLHE